MSCFKRYICLTLILACLLITMPVCSSNPPENQPHTKIYTDMTGRKVELPTEIKSVVVVRYMDLNTMAAILYDEFDDKVVSMGESVAEWDIDNYKKFSEVYDLDKLVVMSGLTSDSMNVEAMLDLDPDIIIVDTYYLKTTCILKMIEVGLPVVYMNMNDDPFYGPLESMTMLGDMLGKSDRVAPMIKYSKNKIDTLLERIDALLAEGAQRPSLYFEFGNKIPSEIGGTRGDIESGWGLLWYRLGADNIGVGHGLEPLDPEIVLDADPDVIVIGGSNWDQTSNIMRMGYFVTPEEASAHLGEYVKVRDGWSDLSAIQNKRLHSIHANGQLYPFNFAIYEYMAKILWPEEFSDIDPQADLEEFFSMYMPVDFSGMFTGQWFGK